MGRIHRLCIAVISMGVTVSLPARSEDASLSLLLAGNRVPLTLKLKDLDATWRRLSIAGHSDSEAMLMFYARLMGGAASLTYYTKGETVTISGETYLLAYRPQTKGSDMMVLMRGGSPPPPESFTPDTLLALSLVQLRTAGSLNDIRPFNLEEEIAAHDRAQEEVHSSIEGPRNKAINVQSMNNLKQVGLGLMMYTEDNGGRLPDLTDSAKMKQVLVKYISNDRVFVRPKTGEPYLPNPTLSGKPLKDLKAGEIVVVYEATPADDETRAVLFLDGHVERIVDARWQELKKSSGIP